MVIHLNKHYETVDRKIIATFNFKLPPFDQVEVCNYAQFLTINNVKCIVLNSQMSAL